MKRPTDDIANWRLQQENTSKPFPYVFPQMPPRFRWCCAFAKAVFLIQWGCFAAFGVCSMVLFIPMVIWGKDMGMSAMIENKPFLAFFIVVAAISLPIFFAAVPFGFTPKLFWRCPCCGHPFPYYVPKRGDNLKEKECLRNIEWRHIKYVKLKFCPLIIPSVCPECKCKEKELHDSHGSRLYRVQEEPVIYPKMSDEEWNKVADPEGRRKGEAVSIITYEDTWEVKEAWYERVFEILPRLQRQGFRDACHTISAVKDYPNVHAGRLREALNWNDLDRNDRISLFHCIQKLKGKEEVLDYFLDYLSTEKNPTLLIYAVWCTEGVENRKLQELYVRLMDKYRTHENTKIDYKGSQMVLRGGACFGASRPEGQLTSNLMRQFDYFGMDYPGGFKLLMDGGRWKEWKQQNGFGEVDR